MGKVHGYGKVICKGCANKSGVTWTCFLFILFFYFLLCISAVERVCVCLCTALTAMEFLPFFFSSGKAWSRAFSVVVDVVSDDFGV